MNPFVDPKKRGFLLPGGCKDLMDALRRSEQQKETGDSAVVRPEARIGGLGHVNHYVEKLLAGDERHSVLGISSLDEYTRVLLERSAAGLTIYPMMGIGETEDHVEEFFESRAIRPCLDFQVGHPGMTTRVFAFALPFDLTKAAEITVDLLHSVFGFDADSEISFVYLETIPSEG